MAGVEEVRRGIDVAKRKSEESLSALHKAEQDLEEAQEALAHATDGTGQDDMQQATGMLLEAIRTINDTKGTIQGVVSTAEGYEGRL
jgi:F0F1-type ATP synthase membrane subunit b/b'